MPTMRHPDLPGRTIECSERQAKVKARSGWVEDDTRPEPEVPTGGDQSGDDVELEALRTRAGAVGVKVDRRWGTERLTAEIEAAQAVAHDD